MERSEALKRGENTQRGFTLWELLLVLSLIGILLVLTPHFGSAVSQVQNRVDLANVLKIEGAVQLYRIDVGTFPRRVSDLVHSPIGVSGWRGPYLEEIPEDPFNPVLSYQLDALGRVKARTAL
ncbi:MAG TPA: prepilin-type cleavage/methylation domain-containing protein [Desulfosporosinus sp.]|nr:MAG: prepilin cleavage protein [Desulfosporosinus sp. BICA1-9]HBW36192.1 prepilin-type cleavage/methylation domain-containing protein [Desulfosporosinus sp.]